MSSIKNYKIIFVENGLEVKFEVPDNTKFCELVNKYFEERKIEKEKYKTKISFESCSTGKIIKWGSQKAMKDLYINYNNYVLVNDTTKKEEREEAELNKIETFPEILADMANLSKEFLDQMAEKKREEEVPYVDYEKALESSDEYIFVLGLIAKYLEEILGINVFIDPYRELFSSKTLKAFRYISSGYITKIKTTVLVKPITKKEFNEENKRKQINDSLKEKITARYVHLNSKNFALTHHILNFDKVKFSLISFINRVFNFGDTIIINSILNYLNIFVKDKYEIDWEIPLMETIILNKSFFTRRNNYDDKDYKDDEVRGNERYYPPRGWIRYGIIASNIYGHNNVWIDSSWCVAYSGLRKWEIEKKTENFIQDEDKRHPGKRVGYGVAVCPKPEDMEEDCEEIEYENKKYKIGFMLRINPESIRIPESGNGKYWVVDGTKNSLRPCSILMKKIQG